MMDGSLDQYYPFFNESFPANLVPPPHPLPTPPIHNHHTDLSLHGNPGLNHHHQEQNIFQNNPAMSVSTAQNGGTTMGLSLGGHGGGGLAGVGAGAAGAEEEEPFNNDLWATMTMNWAAQDALNFDGI